MECSNSRTKNTLIAEKVMGWHPAICDGEMGEQPCSPDGWFCQKCGHEGYWGDDFEHEERPKSYITSMDIAWELVACWGSAKVKKWPNVRRYENKPYGCSIITHGNTFSALGTTPQEAICLASLKAVGVDLEEE